MRIRSRQTLAVDGAILLINRWQSPALNPDKSWNRYDVGDRLQIVGECVARYFLS